MIKYFLYCWRWYTITCIFKFVSIDVRSDRIVAISCLNVYNFSLNIPSKNCWYRFIFCYINQQVMDTGASIIEFTKYDNLVYKANFGIVD